MNSTHDSAHGVVGLDGRWRVVCACGLTIEVPSKLAARMSSLHHALLPNVGNPTGAYPPRAPADTLNPPRGVAPVEETPMEANDAKAKSETPTKTKPHVCGGCGRALLQDATPDRTGTYYWRLAEPVGKGGLQRVGVVSHDEIACIMAHDEEKAGAIHYRPNPTIPPPKKLPVPRALKGSTGVKTRRLRDAARARRSEVGV